MEPKLAVAVFVLFLAFAACSANHHHHHHHHRDPSVVGYSQEDLALPSSLFRSWSVKHGKLYASPTEKLERYEIFKQNLMHIAETNRKNGSYWLGLNQFADVAHEEFKASYLGLKRALPRAGAPQTRTPTAFRYAAAAAGSLPWSVDWRYKGAVTPVKNQGKCGEFRLWTIHERHPLLSVLLCRLDATRRWEMRLQGEQKKMLAGSCWAFSSVAAVEGINQIVTGKLVSLSEQELVDCDTTLDHGCEGGTMDLAFAYMMGSQGIHAEDDYPYLMEEGYCKEKQVRTQKSSHVNWMILGRRVLILCSGVRV
jgi:xylem cysteine proteinase